MKLLVPFCTLWLTWISVVRSEESKVVCYFGSWSVYRQGNGKIQISDISPNLCTHMIYTFVGITEDGNVRVLDPWSDLPDNGGKAGFQNFNALRERSVGTKTMVAIGGLNEGSIKYSKVVANSVLRAKLVENIVKFTLTHGFDGVDIDWEYPNQRGGNPEDVKNYVLLLKELRQVFDKHSLILSAAVAAVESSARLSYDIPGISKYLDFMILMSYDSHGSWEPVTGHSAPLYAAARETTEAARSLNVNATVHYWLGKGAPANKLVVGTGLSGQSFMLTNSAEHVPGSPAKGPGQEGPHTQTKGFLGYNEICELQANGSWSLVWDDEQRVPYAYNGDQWVSYDNVRSVTEKANFIKSLGLGGAMVRSVDTDDFRGVCGEKFPLLNALNRVLRASPGTSDSDCDESDESYEEDSQNCLKFWVCQKVDECVCANRVTGVITKHKALC